MIENKGGMELEDSIDNLKNLEVLILDYEGNNILGEWIGNKLTRLNNLSYLNLNLENNNVDNDSFD